MNTIHTNGSDQGDAIAELARLRAENDLLKAKMSKMATARLHLKVSKAGAISLYGMGQYPVTLYRGQWEKVLDLAQDIRQFIIDNESLLSVKA